MHAGTTTSSGHYYAVIKDATTAQWYNFSDEQVEQFDDLETILNKNPVRTQYFVDSFLQSDPYILFYRRKPGLEMEEIESYAKVRI